jgi:hypothetical protein
LILILFLLFFSSSEIMGILAIGFFAKSMFLLGVVIYILKILPVIISFAILEKGKTKLFSFNWFKICYEFITNLIHKLKENKIYLTIMENISSVKEKIHNYFGNRKSVIKTLFNYSLNKNKNQ